MQPSLDSSKLPRHIAIIMDGNGRWAEKKGATRTFGHENAMESVQAVVEGCLTLKIPYLTLFTFSTENWNRPQAEIDILMGLVVKQIGRTMDKMVSNGILFRCIGDLRALPLDARHSLEELMAATAHNDRLHLTLALNYSGRWEIVRAMRHLAQDVQEGKRSLNDINEHLVNRYMDLHPVPDPELLIRTSGEWRISNFLLWQLAYTELYVTDVLWPDFRQADLYAALRSYARRDRRFGALSKAAK